MKINIRVLKNMWEKRTLKVKHKREYKRRKKKNPQEKKAEDCDI